MNWSPASWQTPIRHRLRPARSYAGSTPLTAPMQPDRSVQRRYPSALPSLRRCASSAGTVSTSNSPSAMIPPSVDTFIPTTAPAIGAQISVRENTSAAAMFRSHRSRICFSTARRCARRRPGSYTTERRRRDRRNRHVWQQRQHTRRHVSEPKRNRAGRRQLDLQLTAQYLHQVTHQFRRVGQVMWPLRDSDVGTKHHVRVTFQRLVG